jgi:Probable Zinc-ribbon domain
MVGGTHLRVGHGWTIDRYREAFHLRGDDPTCSRALSEEYRRAACERLGHRGFGTPPRDAVRGRRRASRWRSLSSARPELLSEVDTTRNDQLDVVELPVSSKQRIWWRCAACGHAWQATIANRVARASGCPRCAKKRRREGRNVPAEGSLAVRRPDPRGSFTRLSTMTLIRGASELRLRASCGGDAASVSTNGARRSPTEPQAPGVRPAGPRAVAPRLLLWRPNVPSWRASRSSLTRWT